MLFSLSIHVLSQLQEPNIMCLLNMARDCVRDTMYNIPLMKIYFNCRNVDKLEYTYETRGFVILLLVVYV